MFTKYFGFKANPFGLAADFSFFKIDAPKQDICNSILRDLNNGCCRFLVTGVSGVGKSQLLRYLFTQLPSNTQCICLSGNIVNYSDRIRFIIELTTENYELRKKSLVVIDNPHEIPEEDLRLLFSLISQNNQNAPIFPIIFCGLDNLEIKLNHLGFKQIIDDNCCRYHLSELNELQVRDYINFRLKRVGYTNTREKEIFSAYVIKLITASSHGIPHSINLICGASLLIASLDDKRTVSEQIVQEATMSCLLSPNNSIEKPDEEPLKNLSIKPLNLHEQNDQNDLINQPSQIAQSISFMAIPMTLFGFIRLLTKNLTRFPRFSNTKRHASVNKLLLQKKFEIEVLSGIGICFLGFSYLFIFNLFDNSNSISKASKVLVESRQTQSNNKNIMQPLAVVEINNQQVKAIKKVQLNTRKGDGGASEKHEIASLKKVIFVKSTPIRFDSFNTEKVNFNQTSAQYFPHKGQQKALFVNINSQETKASPVKQSRPHFRKPSLSILVTPNRTTKSVTIDASIKNGNKGRNSVVDEMEASVRERSSSRLQLDKLGIDYSVEALLKAARQGNVHALKLLLAGGIPPDVKDAIRGISPLLEAAKNGQLQIVQTLLEKGAYADIRNNEGQTALITAVKNSKKTIVNALLNGGANPNVSDFNGKTALSYAVQANNPEIIRLLARN